MTFVQLRTIVFGVCAIVSLFFPGLIPEGTQEVLADHATTVLGGVLGLWSVVAGLRAHKER